METTANHSTPLFITSLTFLFLQKFVEVIPELQVLALFITIISGTISILPKLIKTIKYYYGKIWN